MLAQYWNVTPDERRPDHPADVVMPGGTHLVRAVDVDAEPDVVFRWLCQLKVAPYSYDWIDNLGRRSPRTLTPGADDLAVGQRMMVTRIVGFRPGEHIVGVTSGRGAAVVGRHALSYQVVPGRSMRSRILACLAVDAGTRVARLLVGPIALGDLVMMRRQLLNLRTCAEAAPHPRQHDHPVP